MPVGFPRAGFGASNYLHCLDTVLPGAAWGNHSACKNLLQLSTKDSLLGDLARQCRKEDW